MSLVAGFLNNITMKSGTTVSGGELTQWVGSSYTYTVPAGETGPAVGGNTLNSVEVARFSGDVMSFSDAGYDRGQDFRVQHFVIKGFDNGEFNYIEDAENAVNRSATLHNSSDWQIRNGSNQTSVATKSGNWEILTIVRRNTDDTYDAYIGSTKVSDNVSDASAGSSAGTGSVLGGRGDLTLKGQFDIAQMVFYAGASMPLTEQEILDNISFLDSEWLSSTFTNTTPVDGATGVSQTTQFDWADPENHNNYNLRVSETDFGTAIRDIFTTSKTHTLSSALDALTQYFWKVRKYTPGSLVNVLLYNQQFTASDAWSDFNTQILSGNGSHVVESGKGIQRVNASTFAVADLQTTQISDVEITIEFDASDVTSDIQPSFHFRTQGAWLSNDQIEGYWVFWDGNTLQLGRTNADGGTSAFAGESLSFSRTIDTNVLVKILLEGFRIRVKAYTGSFPGYDGGIDFTDPNQRYSSGGFSLKTASLSTASSNSEVRYDSLVFDEGVQLTNSVDSVSVTPSTANLEPTSEISVSGDIQVSGSFTGAGTWTKESGVAGITIKSTSGNNAVFQSDGTISSGDTNAVFRLTSDEDATKFAETTITPVDAAVVSGSRANDEARLVELANTLDYQTWDTNTGWGGTSMSLSNTIHGVTVDTIGGELRVTEINLSDNGIESSNGLPNRLDELTEMTYFNVFFNSITGTMSTGLFKHQKLIYCYINHTTASPYSTSNKPDDPHIASTSGGGEIHQGKGPGNNSSFHNIFTTLPAEFDMPNLEWFQCSYQDFSGSTIPSGFWNSTKLKYLSWKGCKMDLQTVPSAIGNLTVLRYLLMVGNVNGHSGSNNWTAGPFLNGALPTEVGTLTTLEYVNFGTQEITSIPDLSSLNPIAFGLGNNQLNIDVAQHPYMFDGTWSNVNRAAFDNQPVFGQLPDPSSGDADYGDHYKDFERFTFANCNLSGSFPQALWDNAAGEMINLNIENNGITGSLVQDDDLTGLGYSNWGNIRNILVAGNNLDGNLPEMQWLKPSKLIKFTRARFGNNNYTTSSWDMIDDGREYVFNSDGSINKSASDSSPIVQKTRREWFEYHCSPSGGSGKGLSFSV